MEPSPEIQGLTLFWGVSIGWAVVFYFRTKTLLEPRVLFPLAYALMTGGVVMWKILSGHYATRIPNRYVLDVLYSCTWAVSAFVIGASLGLYQRHKRSAKNTPQKRPRSATDHQKRLVIARTLALLLALTITGIYAYASIRMRLVAGTSQKQEMLFRADPLTLRLYYFSLAGAIVASVALVASDASVNKGRLSLGLISVLLLFGTFSIANGERDVTLVILATVMVNVRYWTRTRSALTVVFLLFIVTVIPKTRGIGVGLEAQLGASKSLTSEDLLESALAMHSANFHVYTNVVSWVPRIEVHRNGSTYWDSMLNVLLFDTGTRERALNVWFVSHYARGSSGGYGFAMDAEAYLNFGWAGPPAVFFIWGWLLGWLYKRSKRPDAGPDAVFMWVLVLVISIFSIRADSRALFKMAFNTFIAAKLIWYILPALLDLRRGTRNNRSTTRA